MTLFSVQDVRYAFRVMQKNPGFTAIAVLALTLGIGANTAVFSIVNAILLRPLPYEVPERLATVRERSVKQASMSVAYPNFLDYKEQGESFENMAAYRWAGLVLTAVKEPQRLDAYMVSDTFFDVLGVPPFKGRNFQPDENKPGASPVTILNYDLWQSQFDSDPDILSKTISLSGRGYSVVGIMPPGFHFPRIAQLYIPIGQFAATMTSRGSHQVNTLARIKQGVSIDRARTELDTISGRLQQQYPDSNSGVSAFANLLQEEVVRDIRPTLFLLLGAVAFVLLIACANVANLLLARAASRHKEVSIRTALGATRGQIIRQLLTESLMLSLAGGILGCLLAYLIIAFLKATTPEGGNIPRVAEISIDASVLVISLLVSILTGLVFGLAPAIQASKVDLNDALKEGGKNPSGGSTHNRFRGLLVVTEIALAVVVLMSGAFMIKSFIALLRVDPGFNPDNVMVAEMALPASRYGDARKQTEFYHELLNRIQTLPGVQAAGIINPLPIGGASNQAPVTPEGRPMTPEEEVQTDFLTASPDYFQAMRISIMKGRTFVEQDKEDAVPVVIVDEKTAETFWPGQDPLGKRLTFESAATSPEPNAPRTPIWRQVVGVARNVKHYGLTSDARQAMYVPYLQAPSFYRGILPPMNLVVQSGSQSIVNAVRREVVALDSNLPIYNVTTMDKSLSNSVAKTRLSVWLMGSFAIVGLVLAAVGVYGVNSYWVTQRTHEIGVRMALGAQPRDVLRMMLGQGMLLSGVGFAVGVIGTYLLVPVLSSLLWGVNSTDPLTLVGISVLLIIVALLACYIPARRATKVDPMIALRYE